MNLLSIFIIPPSLEELENRIRNRGTEDEKVINERINKARQEMPKQDLYQYKVVNDNLENACQQIINIIKQRINE